MEQLLQKAIIAALAASVEMLKIYHQPDFEIEIKSDNSPLTKADKAAHRIIEKLLAGEYPILSEEGKSIPWEERKKWDRFWLVDPLDGTKEFIKRNGEFTVNIALIEKGQPIMGVIVVPVSGELYYASPNGSFKSIIDIQKEYVLEEIVGKQVKLPNQTPGEYFTVVGSRSHFNAETETFIRQIDTNGKPLKMVSRGSSLKLCMVATGEADIYPRFGPTMEWDIAAGHAIALFAGRTIIRSDGEPMTYNKENLLNPFFIVK